MSLVVHGSNLLVVGVPELVGGYLVGAIVHATIAYDAAGRQRAKFAKQVEAETLPGVEARLVRAVDEKVALATRGAENSLYSRLTGWWGSQESRAAAVATAIGGDELDQAIKEEFGDRAANRVKLLRMWRRRRAEKAGGAPAAPAAPQAPQRTLDGKPGVVIAPNIVEALERAGFTRKPSDEGIKPRDGVA